jgi:hypothetical protein
MEKMRRKTKATAAKMAKIIRMVMEWNIFLF